MSTEIHEFLIQKSIIYEHKMVPTKNKSQYQTNLTGICSLEEKEHNQNCELIKEDISILSCNNTFNIPKTRTNFNTTRVGETSNYNNKEYVTCSNHVSLFVNKQKSE